MDFNVRIFLNRCKCAIFVHIKKLQEQRACQILVICIFPECMNPVSAIYWYILELFFPSPNKMSLLMTVLLKYQAFRTVVLKLSFFEIVTLFIITRYIIQFPATANIACANDFCHFKKRDFLSNTVL